MTIWKGKFVFFTLADGFSAVSAVDPYWDWDACCGGISSNDGVHAYLIAFSWPLS